MNPKLVSFISGLTLLFCALGVPIISGCRTDIFEGIPESRWPPPVSMGATSPSPYVLVRGIPQYTAGTNVRHLLIPSLWDEVDN